MPLVINKNREPSTVVTLTAAQIVSPSAAVLSDLFATYQLDIFPYTRLISNGTALVPVSTTAQPNNAVTAVILGDSLIQNGHNATTGYRNNRSIVQHALRKTGRNIYVLNEAGFSGETIPELYARWDTQVSAYNPDIVFFEGGINDVSAGASGATIFSRLKTAHLRAKAEGRRFIYVGCSPICGATGAQFLDLVRQYARTDKTFEFTGGGNRLFDYNVTSAQAATGIALTNAIPDGTHPSAYGANLWANDIVNYLNAAGYGKTPSFSYLGSNSTTGDYLNNMIPGGLVGSANTGFPATTSVARAGVTSNVAMGSTGLQDGLPGRLFQTVWTPGAGVAATDVMSMTLLHDNGSTAAQYAGRTFVGRAYLKGTTVGGNLQGIQIQAIVYDWAYGILADVKDNLLFDASTLGTWGLNTASYEGVFETTPFTLPSTWTLPTQAHVVVTAQFLADTGATLTAQMGCVEIKEITSSL